MNVADRDTMLKLQGDQVLVIIGKDEYLLTIIHFVDGDRHVLQLANRSDRESDPLPFTQEALNLLTPVRHEKAKWKLVL